jgi:hypothetical protein
MFSKRSFLRNKKLLIWTFLLGLYTANYIFDNFPTIVHVFEQNLQKNEPIRHEFKGRKFVIFSSTIEYYKDYYMFYLPMVAQSWRRLNFEPIILLVSNYSLSNSNLLAKQVIKYLQLLNVTIIHVPSIKNYEVITGMLARLFVGILPNHIIRDDDFIITTDTDLFPLSETYLKFDSSESIKLWDVGSCNDFKYNGQTYEMYAMGHIGMRKKQWREVMKIENKTIKLTSDIILKLIVNLYGKKYVKMNHEIKKGPQTEYPVWFLDQMTISIFLKEYVEDKKKANYFKIKYRGTRLARNIIFNSNWLDKSQLKYLTDFHSFQEGVFTKWKLFKTFFSQIFDEKHITIFDNYYSDYMEVRKKVEKFLVFSYD